MWLQLQLLSRRLRPEACGCGVGGEGPGCCGAGVEAAEADVDIDGSPGSLKLRLLRRLRRSGWLLLLHWL